MRPLGVKRREAKARGHRNQTRWGEGVGKRGKGMGKKGNTTKQMKRRREKGKQTRKQRSG